MALMLDSSRKFKDELTSLNDFMLPCAAALWNFRWQIRGYMEEVPSASKQQLEGRFLAGSGINTTNFDRFSRDQSWAQQSEALSKLMLTSQISLFEAWQDSLPGLNQQQRRQVPHTSSLIGRWDTKTGTWVNTKPGLPELLSTLPLDPEMCSFFPPGSRTDEPLFFLDLPQLMLAFRVFKEARNSIVHGDMGSRIGEENYSRFAAMPPLRVSMSTQKPALQVPKLREGRPIELTFLMITGLMSVMYRIVAATDAVLGISASVGPQALIDRCRGQWPRGMKPRKGSQDEVRARLAMTAVRYPLPADPSALGAWLRRQSILP